MDVTVVLNAHREAMLAHPSCSSIELAKAAALTSGIDVEVIAILDRPNVETIEFFSHRIPSDWKLVRVDYGDLGFSRNEGVRLASGRWIAFLDADDLFGRNWLVRAFSYATRDDRLVVWHPEINIYFGRDEHVLCNVDMDDKDFCPLGLISSNYWTSLCFAPRKLFISVPYPKTQLDQQIGYEDWAWNMSVLTRGALHKIVPGTGHLIRRKKRGSLLTATTEAICIPQPSDYFLQVLAKGGLPDKSKLLHCPRQPL